MRPVRPLRGMRSPGFLVHGDVGPAPSGKGPSAQARESKIVIVDRSILPQGVFPSRKTPLRFQRRTAPNRIAILSIRFSLVTGRRLSLQILMSSDLKRGEHAFLDVGEPPGRSRMSQLDLSNKNVTPVICPPDMCPGFQTPSSLRFGVLHGGRDSGTGCRLHLEVPQGVQDHHRR